MNASSSSLDSNTTTTPASSSSSSGSVGKYIPPHRRQTPSPGPTEYLEAKQFRARSASPSIDEPLLTSRIKNAVKYQDLIRVFERYFNQFNPIHINCFFGRLAEKKFINRSRQDTQTLEGLQRLVVVQILKFSPREICNITCYAGRLLRDQRSPFSKNLSDIFLEKKMWTADVKVEEFAMYLNGLSQMNKQDPKLAAEISAYISQNLWLLASPKTSLGALSLLASGLQSHQVLTIPLLRLIIEYFHVKGGLVIANHKEIVNLLKSIVRLEFFDKHFFDSIIQNLVNSRLDGSKESLWYLVSISRCFADMRYDHPKLVTLLGTYLTVEQIGNFHDFDLPNIAMVLAEIAPDDSFDKIFMVFGAMQRRFEQSSYRRLAPDNFLQACWSLACTKGDGQEQLFLDAAAFTLALVENDIERLQPKDRFQLYQIALLVNRDDIVSRLEKMPEYLINDVQTSVSQRLIAAILTSRGYQLTVEKRVGAFSFDIVMEDFLYEGQPVIIEVDGMYHFTQSGKERGSTRLQSQLIKQLGYFLIRVNLMGGETLEWHADEICKQLAISSCLESPCPKQPESEGCFDSLALT